MEWLIGSLLVSAIAGIFTTSIDRAIENDKAFDDKKHQLDILETEKTNEYDKLLANYELEKTKQKDAYNESLIRAEESYQDAIRNENLNYELQKKEDFYAADMTDKNTDLSEKALSTDINNQIGSIGLSQLINGIEYNNALINNGSSKGQSYAQLSNSGIRAGSSLSQAVELESAANMSQLQAQQDAQRKSDSLNLAGIISNLQSGKNNIWNNRESADYTRYSYAEGGTNFEKHSNNIQNAVSTYNQSASQAKRSYLQNLDYASTQYENYKTQIQNTYDLNVSNVEYDYQQYVQGSSARWWQGLFNNTTTYFNAAQNVRKTANDFKFGY